MRTGSDQTFVDALQEQLSMVKLQRESMDETYGVAQKMYSIERMKGRLADDQLDTIENNLTDMHNKVRAVMVMEYDLTELIKKAIKYNDMMTAATQDNDLLSMKEAEDMLAEIQVESSNIMSDKWWKVSEPYN